jgi:hypothetical protein
MGSEVMTTRKAGIAMLAAGLTLGAATVATAQGHGMGQMGPGVMGQMEGMGPSGPMIGPGMMAPGQMAPGMMGPGMVGPGMMPQQGMMAPGQMAPGMMMPGQPGMMMGPGMMMPGQPGMMMGPGMMGPGMGSGMMGQMPQDMMRGRGPMAGLRIMPTMHLTTDDVQHHLEHYLDRHGFGHLQVGEVRQTDDDTITADIVTQEGSLALQLEIDPHTGLLKKFG